MPASRWSMPPSVIYVMVVVSVSLLLQLLMLNPCGAGAAILILAGMFTGHRLAWQWGRVLVPIAAVLMLLAGLAASQSVNKPNASQGDVIAGQIALFVMLASSALFFSIFFALGRKSARVYFQLQCPRCGAFTKKAGDFFFNTAVCGACQLRWRSQADYFRSTARADEEGEELPQVLPADAPAPPPGSIADKPQRPGAGGGQNIRPG